MSSTFKVACVQNCADDDLGKNIEQVTVLTRAAAGTGAALVCLPEHFSYLAPSDGQLLENALAEEDHPALKHFRGLAGELKVWLLLGSLAIKLPSGHMNNRSYLLDDRGGIVARYDKLHLFDVSLKTGESYRESATVEAGDKAVVAATPWGKIGMSVCYDVRFAYLYRRLAQAGAMFLSIPAAFTLTTGQAHWHALVRARAIETGSYVFAPAQCGVRRWGRATFGHSLIVDPWGEVLADAGDGPCFISAGVDGARVDEVRRMIPALTHDRPVPPINS